MNKFHIRSAGSPFLLTVGFIAGMIISSIDNLAFAGEVSPFAIVALMFAATFAPGAIWGWRGALTAATAWMCIPFAHLVKRLFGLPDTLHPNTYASILMLACFLFVIATFGLGLGVLSRRLMAAREGKKQADYHHMP